MRSRTHASRALLVGACLLHAATATGQDTRNAAPAGIALADAVTTALARSATTLGAARRRESAEGALLATNGAFDTQVETSLRRSRSGEPVLSTIPDNALDPSPIVTNLTTYGVGVIRMLRGGVTVAPVIGVTRTSVSAVPGLVTSRGTANLTVTAPLWHDLAGQVTAAPERAARVELAASELDLRHARATSVHATALAYWSYVAATRQLEELRTAETRAARLVEETRALVRADVRTEADVTRLRANLASKRASRIGAEQAVDESWSTLRMVTGLERAADGTATPRPPITDFPEPRLHDDIAQVAAQAESRRTDLAAARQRREGMRVLRDAAAASERPRFDVIVGLGYAGAEHGGGATHLITPLGRVSSGLNSSLQLRHVLPVFNQGARGMLMQSTAAYEQQDLLVADLTRRIEARVAAAMAAIRHAEQTLIAWHESVQLAQEALENEKKKSALGASTLPDVLLSEDALTSAQLGNLTARLAYATALADLRYETGALNADNLDGTRSTAVLLGMP